MNSELKAQLHALNMSDIARQMGVTRAAVSQWATGESTVPTKRVHELERLSGIPRHILRPDLYPVEREREAAAE